MKKYLKKYKWMILFGVLLLSIETMADVMQPAIISQLIDQGVLKKDAAMVIRKGILMLVITGAGAFFAMGRNIMAAKVATGVTTELRYDLYEKIQRLSISDMDELSKASVITRLTNDVNQIQTFINGMMRIFLKAPLVFVGSITMASILNPKLAMVIYLSLPIVIFIMFLNTRLSFPFYVKMQQNVDRLNEKAGEFLSGIRVIRSFNSEEKERQMFGQVNDALYISSSGAMKISSLFNPLVSLVLNMALVILLYYGGFLSMRGEVLPGQMVAFVNYVAQVLFSFNIIGAVFNTVVRAKASYDRLMEILNRPESEVFGVQEEDLAIDELEFQNVSFSYDRGGQVLKKISFLINKGQSLGIIGSIGCGKTTLIHLIPALYEVSYGSIKLNGEDIKKIDKKTLRQRIGVVPQNPMLFSGSVRENLMWGKQPVHEEEMISALKASMSYDFVMNMPGGLDASIGRAGRNLSGGQKQRLSIARALVRKPDILILDDAFSKVDISTEIKMRRSLSDTDQNRITILISQKILSVMKCDKIMVLHDGQITGIGSHKELMRDNPEYIEIYQSQIGGDFDEK